MNLRDVPRCIKSIERSIVKVFRHGEPEDRLALSKMMNGQLEIHRFELVRARKEEAQNKIKLLEDKILAQKVQLAQLEKDGEPFSPFMEDEKPSHTVTVGSSTRKGHSRKKIALDRAAVMERIGKGDITNKLLATSFGMAVRTFADKAKELKIPHRGSLSTFVYMTDEQDGFDSFNGLKTPPAPDKPTETKPKELSLLEAGQRLVDEECFETLLST